MSKWLPSGVLAILAFLLLVVIDFQAGKIYRLNNQLLTHETINKVTQSAITLHYQVSLNNIKAKQLEDSEHVKVKTVIKTVLKDNECANTAVPDDVVSELRKYKRGISARSTGSITPATNR
ncbi:hypothetical protein ACOT1K_09360 [Providencia manganoxydans]|uniref:hypothetical protein n=1 Tax=Providencia manganoxydans TaxID=2923283 RepID=UPI003B9DAA26